MSNLVPNTSFLDAVIGGVVFPMSNYTVLLAGDNGPVQLYYLADDNIGMAQVERFSQRGPAQHGDIDTGYRLEPRPIVLAFGILGTSWGDLEKARAQLIRRFRPSRPVSWRWTQADGTVLQIDSVFNGGMTFGTQDRDKDTWFQRFTIAARCPDPTFYTPTDTVVTIAESTAATGLLVPMVVPFQVATSRLNETVAHTNVGSWDAYPVVRFTGPAAHARLDNLTTGDTLYLLGTTLNSDEWIELDLRYGYKTVLDSAGVNRIGGLSSDSDLAGWRLAPGVNNLRFSARDALPSATVTVTYQPRFVGI